MRTGNTTALQFLVEIIGITNDSQGNALDRRGVLTNKGGGSAENTSRPRKRLSAASSKSNLLALSQA